MLVSNEFMTSFSHLVIEEVTGLCGLMKDTDNSLASPLRVLVLLNSNLNC